MKTSSLMFEGIDYLHLKQKGDVWKRQRYIFGRPL